MFTKIFFFKVKHSVFVMCSVIYFSLKDLILCMSALHALMSAHHV